jgi:hypothetical protein
MKSPSHPGFDRLTQTAAQAPMRMQPPARNSVRDLKVCRYTLNELPQPQVDFTCGLLNLKPEPSRVST